MKILHGGRPNVFLFYQNRVNYSIILLLTFNQFVEVLPLLECLHSTPRNNLGEIWIIKKKFHSTKCISKCHLQNGGHFASTSICYSLWPSDAIWRHRSWSTLAQVMASCLTASSHYLNQGWLIVSTDQWRFSKGNLTRDTTVIIHVNQLQFA